ncbi:MAG TPA: TonB C-terminal domain-containing protein [Thiobacillus sp.]|nr:TonB C-terminal domain-containing protein [Thiobacillus sp.]
MIGDDSKPAWMRWGGVALALVVAVLLVLWLKDVVTSGKPSKPMKVQQITLLRPPPPPPKPPEEKPPEPEKVEQPKEEVKLDQPQPEAPPPPPGGIPDGPAGGMETDLQGGGGIGIGGGGAGDERRSWYSRMISRQLEDELKRAKRLQGKDYRVVAQIWFGPTGAVSRVQLDKGTGDVELDEALRQEIMQVTLREVLPGDIPQPVRLRVVSR